MAAPVDLLVFSLPGLSARMLHEHEGRLPHLRKLAAQSAATLVVVDGASAAQLEASLITGLLPEFLGVSNTGAMRGRPFWLAAEVPARVATQHPLPIEWRALSKNPRLVWRTLPALAATNDIPAALSELDAAIAEVPADRALVLLSAWALADGAVAGQNARPLDRPVLLARGFEQTKTCVGMLEVAGMLQRALTGERLTDEI